MSSKQHRETWILLRLSCILILCIARPAIAQQPASVVYAPGDVAKVVITLAEPTKAIVECSFLRTTEYKPEYSGAITTTLRGRTTEGNVFPQSPQSEYALSVKIPEDVVSGTYRLDSVMVTVPTGNSKYYSGTDLGTVTIEIRNSHVPHFPAIKGITVKPGN